MFDSSDVELVEQLAALSYGDSIASTWGGADMVIYGPLPSLSDYDKRIERRSYQKTRHPRRKNDSMK